MNPLRRTALHLSPGELRVAFETVDQRAEALMHLAVVLDKQLDAFSARYGVPREPTPGELAEREAERADAEYFRNWGRESYSQTVMLKT